MEYKCLPVDCVELICDFLSASNNQKEAARSDNFVEFLTPGPASRKHYTVANIRSSSLVLSFVSTKSEQGDMVIDLVAEELRSPRWVDIRFTREIIFYICIVVSTRA